MNCVSYFDLLGTKGFCEDKDLYFRNINEFYYSIYQLSYLLEDCGKVGVFSDCAYATSSDPEVLVNFMVKLRDRLSSKQLFFNAVIKSGNLGVSKADGDNLFGVVFEDSTIADVYITHSNFKGIGIFVDEEVKNFLKDTSKFEFVDSIYTTYKNNDEYDIVKYNDIWFNEVNNGRYAHQTEDMLTILLRQWIQAHSKSKKYGRYYLSIIITMLRSYRDIEFKWHSDKKEFSKCPFIIKIMLQIIKNQDGSFDDFVGLDYILFVILDIIYSNPYLTDYEKTDITIDFMKVPHIKNKYSHNLELIPSNLFLNTDNRAKLVKTCQEGNANEIISKYVNNQ